MFAPSTADLLDELKDYSKRFLVLPDEICYDVLAAWICHSYVIDALPATPRLALLSPEPGSGKTRVLEVLQLLCERPLLAANASSAAMFRLISTDQRPTLLLDESDTYLLPGSKGYRDDLRGVIDAGYRPGSQIVRCEPPSMRPGLFETYSAVAIAGLGRLPNTILERSIVFWMHKRARSEKIEPFRWRIQHDHTELLRQRLNTWADENLQAIDDLLSGHPLRGLEDLGDRAAEIWEPLLAIAVLAGTQWQQRLEHAAKRLANTATASEQTLGVRLLADIRSLLNGHDRIASTELAKVLNEMEESPWGGWPLDARTLARKLKPYGIGPQQIRLGDRTCKGYLTDDFADPWDRYLPLAETTETSETTPRY